MSMTRAQKQRARENAQRGEDHRAQMKYLQAACPMCQQQSLTHVDSRDEDGLVQRNFPNCGHAYPQQAILEAIHAEQQTFLTGEQYVSPAVAFIESSNQALQDGKVHLFYRDEPIKAIHAGEFGMMTVEMQDERRVVTHISNPKLRLERVEANASVEAEQPTVA